MRSREEILFRLRQEARNLWLWRTPPRSVPAAASPLPRLPHPEIVAASLRNTDWAASCVRLAESVLAHRIPLLGRFLDAGPQIDWRRDYERGITSGLRYFRRVPYLDVLRVGDHKNVWELNRHQHLVLLSQAWRLTGRDEFLQELWAQLESWLAQNPFAEGINWASALEIAFRALSWAWIFHLAGERMPGALRPRFLASLYQHGLFLENNFSIYFSPNTHLLGEAVALHALGVFFPHWPAAERWRSYGGQWVRRELERQVQPDGLHFEQSTYYHVYALDMYLFHAVLADDSEPFRPRIQLMSNVLALLLGTRGAIPFLGDDDGGRFFYPYGPRDQFGRGTLAACAQFLLERPLRAASPYEAHRPEQAAWLLGPGDPLTPPLPLPALTALPDSGLVLWNTPDVQIVLDAGPFGAGSAGHSHADTLSVVIATPDEEILIDPGTYTYVGDLAQRERFRGSAMHNTLHVPGLEQADAAGPFRWRNPPRVTGGLSPEGIAAFTCHTVAGYRHERRVRFVPPDLILIVDAADRSTAQLHWHAGALVHRLSPTSARIGVRTNLLSTAPLDVQESWRSRTYGEKEPAPCVCVTMTAPTATVIDLSGTVNAVTLRVDGTQYHVSVDGNPPISL